MENLILKSFQFIYDTHRKHLVGLTQEIETGKIEER